MDSTFVWGRLYEYSSPDLEDMNAHGVLDLLRAERMTFLRSPGQGSLGLLILKTRYKVALIGSATMVYSIQYGCTRMRSQSLSTRAGLQRVRILLTSLSCVFQMSYGHSGKSF